MWYVLLTAKWLAATLGESRSLTCLLDASSPALRERPAQAHARCSMNPTPSPSPSSILAAALSAPAPGTPSSQRGQLLPWSSAGPR